MALTVTSSLKAVALVAVLSARVRTVMLNLLESRRAWRRKGPMLPVAFGGLVRLGRGVFLCHGVRRRVTTYAGDCDVLDCHHQDCVWFYQSDGTIVKIRGSLE